MPQNINGNDSLPITQAKDASTPCVSSAYKQRLKNWAVARIEPNQQQTVVARFRSRSDADGHLQCLRQLSPNVSFMMMFDRQQTTAPTTE